MFFSQILARRSKDTTKVNFPLNLNLSKYIIGPNKEKYEYELIAISVY